MVVDAKAGETELGDPHVIVDALFGTGFAGEPRPEAAALIERMMSAHARVLAIDIPSGVDASTGEIAGAVVRADETVTFHGRKVGLVVAPGRFHVGTVHVVDIGLTHEPSETQLATVELLRSVPRRAEGDNKYTAGHVLVVGGSRRPHRRAVAVGARRVSRRRRLRHGRRARVDDAGVRAAFARGGEAAASR